MQWRNFGQAILATVLLVPSVSLTVAQEAETPQRAGADFGGPNAVANQIESDAQESVARHSASNGMRGKAPCRKTVVLASASTTRASI